MTKFTDHIHSEILNIAEKNLNADKSITNDNFDNILKRIAGTSSWTVVEPRCHFTK